MNSPLLVEISIQATTNKPDRLLTMRSHDGSPLIVVKKSQLRYFVCFDIHNIYNDVWPFVVHGRVYSGEDRKVMIFQVVELFGQEEELHSPIETDLLSIPSDNTPVEPGIHFHLPILS